MATKINTNYLIEYKRLMQTTDLQKSYQEFIRFFKELRAYLAGNLPSYKFTGNIIENGMDYSYFQFTDPELSSSGLKIVIAFVHKDCVCEVWLSGVNRDVQSKYHKLLSQKGVPLEFSADPERVDYIVKQNLINDLSEAGSEKILAEVKTTVAKFADKLKLYI